ncbi:peptide-methionine (S)-S-oxide reductase MsrA [Candidatus Fermentibacteria bacterium]|nr:peptide-methionine (S)-S-oxide reductase MsrA [Candidatus Fermentibacteria bacterium]
MRQATLGGGCFWCLEAIFSRLRGVVRVIPGYAGGYVESPSYEQVCAGATGHAEVVRIEFDPEEIGYDELLEVFFSMHDPTTPNRQGADVGPQYRSIILYHDRSQRKTAERVMADLGDSVVTVLVPMESFWPAEDYHVDYYLRNADQPYCRTVIEPKLRKLFRKHDDQSEG